MEENEESNHVDRTASLQAAWDTLKPGRKDFSQVVSELDASKLVGEEGSDLEGGSYATITHLG